MDEPRHVEIDIPADEDVEIVYDDCGCPKGAICPDDGLFAEACPRRRALAAQKEV